MRLRISTGCRSFLRSRPGWFRWTLVAAVGLGIMLPVAAAAAPNRTATIRFSFVTPRVSPGGVATFRVAATGRNPIFCGLILVEANGEPVSGLPLRQVERGRVTWTYRVPKGAPTGQWKAEAVCGAAKVTKTFTVGDLVAPAQVKVTKTGFTQNTSGGGNSISYGLVLTNSSTTSDALNVKITVTFVDTLGRSLTSSDATITGIPAGQSFYLGGTAFSNVTLNVANLQTKITIGSSQKRRLVLPPVQNLQIATGELGSKSLTGSLSNPYAQPLPSTARIYEVELDASGNIIGGDSESTGAVVQPHATVGFTDSFLPDPVASVEASVDPCGYVFEPSDCPALSGK